MDDTFTIKQVIEKWREFNIKTHCFCRLWKSIW